MSARICMNCAHHKCYGHGVYKCTLFNMVTGCIDEACDAFTEHERGFTPMEVDKTVELVIPVPMTEEYETYGMHMFFYPSKCGAFDRDGLSAIADRLERDAKSMVTSPYWITPNDLRRYAEKIRESIRKADADEQQ